MPADRWKETNSGVSLGGHSSDLPSVEDDEKPGRQAQKLLILDREYRQSLVKEIRTAQSQKLVMWSIRKVHVYHCFSDPGT